MIALDNEHNYPIALTPKTAAGNPARVDGVPVWASDNPAAFTLAVAEDGLSAKIMTADTGAEVRSGTLTITADADLGEGVKTISFEGPVVVGPAFADNLGIELGVGEPK